MFFSTTTPSPNTMFVFLLLDDNGEDEKDTDDPFNNYYTFDDEDFEVIRIMDIIAHFILVDVIVMFIYFVWFEWNQHKIGIG